MTHSPPAPASIPVSVVVLARNEAHNIERCLSALSWTDDVIVVDDGSTDETAALAESLGARVVSHSFVSFALQRNWALRNANLKYDWALMLDADEVATPEFAVEMATAIRSSSPDVRAFRTCRKTMFMGRWLRYTDGFPVWIMRLVRVGEAWFEDSGHGEVPVPAMPPQQLGTIHEPFIHYPFSRGVDHWVDRHLRYAANEAEVEQRDLASIRWLHLFSRRPEQRRRALRNLGRKLPGRPVLRFLYHYILKGGFLEGRGGLAFSFLMAFYEGLIVIKRWEAESNQPEVQTGETAARTEAAQRPTRTSEESIQTESASL